MKLLSAAALKAGYDARFPSTGVLGSVEAGADKGNLGSVEAAGLRPFASMQGSLKIIKAIEHFFVAGVVVPVGDLVEVAEEDAKRIIDAGRALFATDEEIAAAKKASK